MSSRCVSHPMKRILKRAALGKRSRLTSGGDSRIVHDPFADTARPRDLTTSMEVLSCCSPRSAEDQTSGQNVVGSYFFAGASGYSLMISGGRFGLGPHGSTTPGVGGLDAVAEGCGRLRGLVELPGFVLVSALDVADAVGSVVAATAVVAATVGVVLGVSAGGEASACRGDDASATAEEAV